MVVTMKDDRIRANEAADLIGIAPATLANWRRFRKGPPFTHPGGQGDPVYYSRAEVVKWKADRERRQQQIAELRRMG